MMVGDDGKTRVYMAGIAWNDDDVEMLSVHATRDSADKVLRDRGFVPSGKFSPIKSVGEFYVKDGNTRHYPYAFAEEWIVKP